MAEFHEFPHADTNGVHSLPAPAPFGGQTPPAPLFPNAHGSEACIGGEVVTLRHRVVAVDSDAAGCSTSYCAGSNGFSGPEYPTCDGCNADGTRTVLLAEEAAYEAELEADQQWAYEQAVADWQADEEGT